MKNIRSNQVLSARWLAGNLALGTRRLAAFTLIELLAVITIIAIVAALVAAMSKNANIQKGKTRVSTQVKGLTAMIENYHAKLNYYPPDNGLLAANTNALLYDGLTAANPLFYELTGVTNLNNAANFSVYKMSNFTTINASDYTNVFHRGGPANCDSSDPQDFYQPGPMPQEVAPYLRDGTSVIYGVILPVQLIAGNTNNFIHYDASSTNRHNMNSYDIWAEYTIGSQSYTNGNW